MCSAPKFQDYGLKDDLLFLKGRIMLPHQEELIREVLLEFHSSKTGGHAGEARTTARISAQYFWPDMQQHIRHFVRECQICQQAKMEHALPANLLQPLLIPNPNLDDISMDFITNLPSSHGFSTILVMVDKLSKFGHYIPMKSDYTTKMVAEAFVHNIVKLYGIRRSIVSNRDKVFISSFWQHLSKA